MLKNHKDVMYKFLNLMTLRSEEIKPKAGIATPNTRGQFAPNEIKNFEIRFALAIS